MGYLFISYNKNDKVQADYLRELLIKKNIDVWMAPYDIAPGSIYAEEIVKAIKGCYALVLLLSNDSQKSQHVGKEINKAVDLDKKIYAIQLEDVTLSDSFDYYLCDHQIINIYKDDFNEENIFKNFINFLDKSVFKNIDMVKDKKSQSVSNPENSYSSSLLNLLDSNYISKNEEIAIERVAKINEVFEKLLVGAKVISYTIGPNVTRYDIAVEPNVSVNWIRKYIDDISISLGGVSVRFNAIVPGKTTSCIEIPNEIIDDVTFKECITALPTDQKHLLNISFGKNINSELVHASIKELPHMLVTGMSGSGKSTFLHSNILTLIMRNKPEDLKIILINPKKFELYEYHGIPHLLCPVITDMKKAFNCLKKLVYEMENRYDLFLKYKVRDITGYNEYAIKNNKQSLPYIVVFIDEYADLVEQVKEVREPVQRIVQKARAAGIHLVIATQRPTVNVIDGVIKANIATRVALMSASTIDSFVTIGEGDAEKLIGKGDMLINCPVISLCATTRVKGCLVTEKEISEICSYLRSHYKPQYDPNFLDLEYEQEKATKAAEPAVEAIDKNASEEQQYQEIKEQVMLREFCSISFIQRSFAMGFPRAGKIFARLIKEGIVDGDSRDIRGSKVLVHKEEGKEGGNK